jgi:hypothetical protein
VLLSRSADRRQPPDGLDHKAQEAAMTTGRWLLLVGLSVFIGIYTAEMIVYMPDWWADFYNFWIRGGWMSW